MNRKLLAALAITGFMLVFAGSARADFSDCATIENVSGVDASVCFTVSSGVLTVNSITVNGGSQGEIAEIGWNTAANYQSTTSDGTWTDSGHASDQIDGFGDWLGDVAGSSFGKPPANGPGTTWTFDANPGTSFVFHVFRYGPNGSCSVFVSTREHAGDLSSPAAGCDTVVPEPGSLMLFGTGLLSMAGFLRRKLFA